jgi:molybdopterin-containing oxidoreductase family iron-sulfur binding subunit
MDKKNKMIVQRPPQRPELTTLAETDLTLIDEGPMGGLLERVPPITRRNFLKGAGYSITGLMLAACSRAPVQNAIPLLIQPEEIVPGQSLWYASTCHGCTARCGVLVKNRDGRPIKLEGNSEHPLSQGGLCAVGQSQVLGLYDSLRINQPIAAGQKITWAAADKSVASAIAASVANDKSIVILTESILSPSTKFWLERFTATHANARHITYDPLSSSSILQAQQINFGRAALPQYHFDLADLIVSMDADFLGTWISPVEYTKAYRKGRELSSKRHSEHIQIEGRMSITGAKADTRIVMSPHEMAQFTVDLEAEVRGAGTDSSLAHDVASKLKSRRGRSLVVSGSDDAGVQILVNRINQALGNIGKTIDLKHPSYQRQGLDRDLKSLIDDMAAGQVGTLIVHGVSPLFDLPQTGKLTAALEQVDFVVAASGLTS